MWNLLLTLIVIIIIFMLNPLKFTDLKPTTHVEKKTQTEVNQVVDEATNQVNYARQMQQQEQNAQSEQNQ